MSDPFILDLGKDGQYEFVSLTVADYATLQARVSKSLRDANRELADELQMGTRERGLFLKETDPRSITFSDVEVFLSDDRNARAVLMNALTKSGRTPEEARSVIEKISIFERWQLARHVAGIINLSQVPEESREATERMKQLVRAKFGLGVEDCEKLTIGEFYSLVEKIAAPRDSGDKVADWFVNNTVDGTAKKVA